MIKWAGVLIWSCSQGLIDQSGRNYLWYYFYCYLITFILSTFICYFIKRNDLKRRAIIPSSVHNQGDSLDSMLCNYLGILEINEWGFYSLPTALHNSIAPVSSSEHVHMYHWLARGMMTPQAKTFVYPSLPPLEEGRRWGSWEEIQGGGKGEVGWWEMGEGVMKMEGYEVRSVMISIKLLHYKGPLGLSNLSVHVNSPRADRPH